LDQSIAKHLEQYDQNQRSGLLFAIRQLPCFAHAVQ